ncbi:phage holin family protein [Akkermansiaceae bacterium]|jgi:uncharacterized membrane protein YqjE|nr:phage holin family protein [Akkermansiaceae bacterium]
MGFGRKKSSSDENASGLKEELGAFIDEAFSHARIRGELFAIEAKEAAGIYGRKFGFTVAGLVCLAIGYLLIVSGLIGLLGFLLEGLSLSLLNWTGAAFAIAILHLIVGAVLIKKGKKSDQNTRVFEYTRNEFKKDQQWIRQEKKR